MTSENKPGPAPEHDFGPLSKAEFEREMKRLVRDLSFYARGPVRIKLIGGDHIAYTYGTEDKDHTINVVFNPKMLSGIRKKNRAIDVLRGIGFHELAHHLWPAEAQYQQAAKEGFQSLFNLVDDEQNERRGRAEDPSWGACFQSVCAYIFPLSRLSASSDTELDVGIEDDDKGKKKPAKGVAGAELYRKRWNEFAVRFRRQLPLPEDGELSCEPMVRKALTLIPARFKDLTKPELLELTRSIHELLADGIKMPAPADAARGEKPEENLEPEEEESEDGAKMPPPLFGLPGTPWWSGLFNSKWAYFALAAFIMSWGLLFAQGGSEFWSTVFYWMLGFVLTVLGIRLAYLLLKWISSKLPRWQVKAPALKAESSDVGWFAGMVKSTCQRVSSGFTKLRISRPVRYLLSLARRLRAGISSLILAVRKLWRRALKMSLVRISIVSVIPAVWLVILWALLMQGEGEIPLWLTILAALLFILATIFGWLFRKRIKDFLLGDPASDMQLPCNYRFDMPLDKETLEFNVLSRVERIEADSEVLTSTLGDVYPLARQLRPYLLKCGSVMTDLEDQPQGHDFVDEIEQIHMGETSLMVDDTEERQASLHVEVAVDCSSSMESSNETLGPGEKFKLAKLFALVVEEAVRGEPGISARFWGFTDRVIYDCGVAGEGRISGLKCAGGNNDSAMLWHMGRSAATSDKKVKMLFMLSDGQPSDCSWGSLHNLVLRFEREGMIPWQFALDRISDPAFERYLTDLCGQSLSEAIITMGRTLASLAEEGL